MNFNFRIDVSPIDIRLHLPRQDAELAVLDKIAKTLQQVLTEVKTMSAVVDDLKAAVAAQGTVIESAVTFIMGVPALVSEAVRKALEDAGVGTAETEAAVAEADATIEAQTESLKAALVAGTGEPLPTP